MAKLWITEYKDVGADASGLQVSVARHPPAAVQTPITFSGTSAQSAAFSASTRFIRLRADATCHFTVAANPMATTNDTPLDANSAEYFEVPAGSKIAVIAG